MQTKALALKNLSLDLTNFRTVEQKKEVDAVHALIAIDTSWFWALMESLIDDGYLPTENIIILKDANDFIVKEGNRRVAALKLIHGLIPRKGFNLPRHIDEKINLLTDDWFDENSSIPCTIYGQKETDIVDKIVTLTHGKGEYAGRAKWKAIARARHNREKNASSEPALDLLEKYLKNGKNLSEQQAERWAGDYPLSILSEAMRLISPRLNLESARNLADLYPKISPYKNAIDRMIYDIGIDRLGFKQVRATSPDFSLQYGAKEKSDAAQEEATPKSKSRSAEKAGEGTSAHTSSEASIDTTDPKTAGSKAVPITDPRAVKRALRAFSPKGNKREKLVTLIDEALQIKIEKCPHAFCFLLRSMFEISAKAYCNDHENGNGPKAIKASGEDRALVDVLRDIHAHLTKNSMDKLKTRKLHGAMVELGKAGGLLSVQSMNQLIHNPHFSVTPRDIYSLFGNIFPLLEEMSK